MDVCTLGHPQQAGTNRPLSGVGGRAREADERFHSAEGICFVFLFLKKTVSLPQKGLRDGD